MKALAVLLGLVFISLPVSAEHVLREISWPQLKEQGKLHGGRIVMRNGVPYLKVVNTADRRLSVKITDIDKPGIEDMAYALRGTVAYKDVRDVAYLEMWSALIDGSRYFSRTLQSSGPMRYIEGSSRGRRLVVPFYLQGTKLKPFRLTLNVVMQGKGEILIGPLELVEYSAGEDPLAAPGEWWSNRTGALIGGIAGTLMGLLGALIGVLSSTGRARVFVIGVMRLLVAVGVISLVMGITAVVTSQPYAVWYPLVLLGILATAIMGGLLPSIRKRYEEFEFRRMQAQDIA